MLSIAHLVSQGTGMGTQADLALSPVLPAGPQVCWLLLPDLCCRSRRMEEPIKKIFFFSYGGIASLSHFTTVQVHFDLHIESSMF